MFPIAQIAGTICFLFGFLMLIGEHEKKWNWLVLYVLLIATGDWSGWWMTQIGLHNHWLYNIITVIEVVFMGYFFLDLYPSKLGKYAVSIGLSCISILFVSELVENGIHMYASDAQVAISIWLIAMALGYYYYLLKDENYLPLQTHPDFWFVTGVLLFYLGNIATNLFFGYFSKINIANFRSIIYTVLNLILYGCWSYAFICKYRKKILS